MIVPRRAESYENIDINSFGFTGNILVKSEEALQIIKKVGPITVLQHLTFPLNNKESNL
jgi:ATP adenylyltransferase